MAVLWQSLVLELIIIKAHTAIFKKNKKHQNEARYQERIITGRLQYSPSWNRKILRQKELYYYRKLKTYALFGLTVGLSSSKKICVICLVESPLKMMKNVFYFILKALSFLKIFKFSSWLLGNVEKAAWLERQG